MYNIFVTAHFIPAAMIFVISFAGCDPTAPTILFSLSLVMNGAAYAGAYCSALDLSPNFAGTVFGLCCTFGSVGSVAISYLSSQVLNGAVSLSLVYFLFFYFFNHAISTNDKNYRVVSVSLVLFP